MIHELKENFSIDTVSLVSSNDFINITEIPFPAVSIVAKLVNYKEREYLNNSVYYDYEELSTFIYLLFIY